MEHKSFGHGILVFDCTDVHELATELSKYLDTYPHTKIVSVCPNLMNFTTSGNMWLTKGFLVVVEPKI